MRSLAAMFVSVCMVLVSASLGAVLFLAAGLPPIQSSLVALAALICLVLYNATTNRLRDRTDVGDQIADLSKGTSDLARQVAEMSRRVSAMEERVDATVDKARGVVDPITAEMGELGGLVKQLAETVAIHDEQLRGGTPAASPAPANAPLELTTADMTDIGNEPAGKPQATAAVAAAVNGRFRNMTRDAVIAMIAGAVDANRVDLYLQPIVTLPQRKVRYYEAVTRLRTPDGDVIPAEDFLEYAEAGGVMPKIDSLLLFRCVQVVRRLLVKNRDVGLFCNISMSTLTDANYFRQFHDFMQANRALSDSLMFEFRQDAYRQFGAIENEGLSALADLGFRFSLDHLTDLRMEPRELFDRGVRFLKAPARLLLHKTTGAQSDIDPADLANLLARSNIDLIAERIESENMVVDLLDFEVKFGQGLLFSPPRPVRPEALNGGTSSLSPVKSANGTDDKPAADPAPAEAASAENLLAAPEFVRHNAPAA
jgi:cyclic-di-GMP phosphodiesterase TipF (flagellum assembly factor)